MLVYLSALPMLVKQYINIQQLVIASQWIAEGDAPERAKRE
jgi:CDP-diacylglycerol--inositol 3-phosphatidyltransferase